MENKGEEMLDEAPFLPAKEQRKETRIKTVMGETEEIIPEKEPKEKKGIMPFDKRLKWAMITFIAIMVIANQISTELSNYLGIVFAILIYFIGDVINHMNRRGRLE